MEKRLQTIESQIEIAPGIFDLRLRAPEIAGRAVPGQFLNVYCADESRLLPRPLSICEADAEGGSVRVVYRVVGAGTREFAALREGDRAAVLGPLGNGFPIEEARGRRILLVGGGIGIPPLLFAAREAARAGASVCAVLGFKDASFLEEEFRGIADTYIAAEDAGAAEALRGSGKAVTTGTVLDAIREGNIGADLLFACGPKPMLAAIRDWAASTDTPAYLSLEERMACGVGACLACVCKTAGTDAHTNVKSRRVCKDGPVFDAKEVIL